MRISGGVDWQSRYVIGVGEYTGRLSVREARDRKAENSDQDGQEEQIGVQSWKVILNLSVEEWSILFLLSSHCCLINVHLSIDFGMSPLVMYNYRVMYVGHSYSP